MGSFLYVQINIVNIIVLMIMMVRVHRAGLEQVTSRRCFQSAMLFSMLMNLFDAFWTLGLHGLLVMSQELLKCLNAGYFLSFAVSAYFWLLFTEMTYGRPSRNRKRWWAVSTVPITSLLVLLVISDFNGCMFYFDAAGVYHRGPLFYLQHMISYFYVLAASIRYIELALEQSYRGTRGKLLTYMSFSVPPIVCAVIQVFLQQFPILSTSPVLSFLIVYTEIIQVESVIDPLTGIHNRKHLKQELEERIHHLPKDCDLYFLFMDVDGFKIFNDRFGHLEGDRVLRTVAKALSEFCKDSRNLCVRYGGDEFAMIVELPGGETIEAVTATVRDLVQKHAQEEKLPTTITLSIGSAVYQRDKDTPGTLIGRADVEMYKKKELSDIVNETKFLEKLYDAHFDGAMLVRIKDHRMIEINRFITKKLIDYIDVCNLSYEHNFKEVIEKRVSDVSRKHLQEAISIDAIVARLKKDGSFFEDFQFERKGKEKFSYKRLNFRFFGKSDEYIGFSVEDISSVYENDIDPLTGILDSTGFHKRVKSWLLAHPGQKYRVSRYNIDHFKDINGMYGYDGGDVLLREIGSYMHSFDTEDYFCGHLSADHFIRFAGENTTTAEECHARFVEHFRDYGLAIPISIHIGV